MHALAQEGEILFRLSHPNIVRLLGVVVLEDGPRGPLSALVLEFLEGGTIEGRLNFEPSSSSPHSTLTLEKSQAFNPCEAAAICAQVASALAYLHAEVLIATFLLLFICINISKFS